MRLCILRLLWTRQRSPLPPITAVPAQHGVAATADPDVGRWKVLSWLLFRYLPLATHEQVLEEVATRRIEVHDA